MHFLQPVLLTLTTRSLYSTSTPHFTLLYYYKYSLIVFLQKYIVFFIKENLIRNNITFLFHFLLLFFLFVLNLSYSFIIILIFLLIFPFFYLFIYSISIAKGNLIKNNLIINFLLHFIAGQKWRGIAGMVDEKKSPI